MRTSRFAGEAARTVEIEQPRAPAMADRALFRAERVRISDAAGMLACMAGLEGGVCQSPLWLESWLSVFGQSEGTEVFFVLLRDRANEVRLALPLARRQEHGLAIIEAMDFGVSDYAAPLLRRKDHAELPRGDALWQLIAPTLPEADVIRLERMAPMTAGMENPLYEHPRSRVNRLAGWVSPGITNWDEFFAGLSPKQRDNAGKNKRRFLRQPGASIRIIEEPSEGLAALECLDAFQKARIGDKGLDFSLDHPDIAAFYRALVLRGMADGKVLIVEMRAGEEVVAVNFSILTGQEALYLRVGNQFGEWSKMSPGVTVTELAIEEAIRRGVRDFDFGMGDYIYKRRLGAREYPLRDLVLPLSLRGTPHVLLWHARAWASRSPLVRRLTGREALPADKVVRESAAA